MNLTSIKLSIKGAHAWATVDGPLTSGMVGIPVTIEYDDAWKGLIKNLMCRCSPWGSNDGEIRTILNVGETSTVAHEVMQAGMYLHLGVEGFSSDGTLVIPTTWAQCGKIEYGANTCEDPSTDPELPIWNQLQTEVAQIKRDGYTQEQIDEIQAYVQSASQAATRAERAEGNSIAASNLSVSNTNLAEIHAKQAQASAENAKTSASSAANLANGALQAQRAAEAAAERAEAVTDSEGNATVDINIQKWRGKKIVTDGSSITSGGVGKTIPTWPEYLRQIFGLEAAYNHAVSGSGWFSMGTSQLIDRIAEYEDDADAVIIMGDYNGANMYVGGGTIEDEPDLEGSGYAKLKYLAERLIEKYPLCPIIWVVEPPRKNTITPMTGSNVADVILEVARYYGFQTCDLLHNTVFRPWATANFAGTTDDGVHPWTSVQGTMAQVIAETMKATPLLYDGSYNVFETVPATGITLDKTELLFTSSASQRITAIVTPSDSTDTVRWTSSNNSVATVNGGVVSPVSNGSAKITAYAGNVSAECNVTVNIEGGGVTVHNITRNLTGCTSSSNSATVNDGDTLTETITAADGYVLAGATATVTMGGEDVSDHYSNGILNIQSVTGDVVITINAVPVSGTVAEINAETLNPLYGYLNGKGEIVESETLRYTGDYLHVVGGTTLECSRAWGGLEAQGHYYDADKNYLGILPPIFSSSYATTLPEDAVFVRVNMGNEEQIITYTKP